MAFLLFAGGLGYLAVKNVVSPRSGNDTSPIGEGADAGRYDDKPKNAFGSLGLGWGQMAEPRWDHLEFTHEMGLLGTPRVDAVDRYSGTRYLSYIRDPWVEKRYYGLGNL
jgi:hypothetical protein